MTAVEMTTRLPHLPVVTAALVRNLAEYGWSPALLAGVRGRSFMLWGILPAKCSTLRQLPSYVVSQRASLGTEMSSAGR